MYYLNNKHGGGAVLINGGHKTIVDMSKFNFAPPIKKGVIIAFNGTHVPSGWILCDGKHGTPDMTNRIPFGSTGKLGEHLGSDNVALSSHSHTAVTSNVGNHTHSVATSTARLSSTGAHTHLLSYFGGHRKIGANPGFPHGKYDYTHGFDADYTSYAPAHSHNTYINAKAISYAGNHAHGASVVAAGSSGTGKNVPPSYMVLFIMKL